MTRLVDVFESENGGKRDIFEGLYCAIRVDIIEKAFNLFETYREPLFNIYDK